MELIKFNDVEWEVLMKYNYGDIIYMLVTSMNDETSSMILKSENGIVSEIVDETEVKGIYNKFVESTDEMTLEEKNMCYFVE